MQRRVALPRRPGLLCGAADPGVHHVRFEDAPVHVHAYSNLNWQTAARHAHNTARHSTRSAHDTALLSSARARRDESVVGVTCSPMVPAKGCAGAVAAGDAE